MGLQTAVLVVVASCVPLLVAAAATSASTLRLHPRNSSWSPAVNCSFDAQVDARVSQQFPCSMIEQIMLRAITHIQGFLKMRDDELLRRHSDVHLTVVPQLSGTRRGETVGNRIKINGQSVLQFLDQRGVGEASTLVHYLVYHEMTHVWQNLGVSYGDPNNPEHKAVIEGIADFMAFAAGYKPVGSCHPPSRQRYWSPRGYCDAAEFFAYLEMKRRCFVLDLNAVLFDASFNECLMYIILQQYPRQLWDEYVTEYTAGRFTPPSPAADICPRQPTPQLAMMPVIPAAPTPATLPN